MKKIFSICFLAAFLTVNAQNDGMAIKKIETVFGYIDQFYVEDVDNNKIAESVIKNVLKELDPHSVYISKEEVEEMNEPLVGNFEGVGIQFNLLDDTILVVATIAGGPSEKVGILAGDRIVKIDDELVAKVGFTNKDVMERLRGKKGTEVIVEIKRDGVKKLLDFKIQRDKIPIYSVDASYMASEKIGYIKVNRFAAKTPIEFRDAIMALKAKGMETLIVDLQGNSGGYLNAAFQMADEFLSDGKLIVYTEGENSPRNEMKATSYGHYEEGNVVVLIDQYSASASEILSGAIQDWDRGLVIGRRSFGKGLVQRPFPLPDGAQIRLTIADYYTPSGRFIQKPYTNGVDDYRQDILHRFESGELTDSTLQHFPDSLKFTTPNGRTVYGGGGITPDIYVPLDTSFQSDFYSNVLRKGIINKYTLNYSNKNRNQLSKFYPTIESFDENFLADEDFLNEFIEYCKENEIEVEEADLLKSGNSIAIQMKALIARNIYDGEAFYYIYNKQLNNTFKTAIEAIENDWFKKYNVTWTKK